MWNGYFGWGKTCPGALARLGYPNKHQGSVRAPAVGSLQAEDIFPRVRCLFVSFN